ncbi:hypothetical protein GWK91_14800 [Virgibacillus sp. MSP4-1]|uniref:YppG family protein n=1 Tax=Virgibacillus sp. MSP4-1 TaxID=2700081 RepID=UPI0003AA4438|nr:YppG family protein [Virgibacillus sp. MSP4-1]QHS24108.1 hypothetical protein GWK91_14800 [Virgibacillus sp. MSP4-1]
MQRNWNQQPNPFQQMYPPQSQYSYQSPNYPKPNQGMNSPYESFQKPPMPIGQNSMPPNQMGGPYPKGANPFLQAFQDQNGQMDFDKVFSTVGQVVDTVHQVSPIVKQVGSFMKNFKG